MLVTDLFPSRFVKGEDIGAKRPTVTIKRWSIEEMGKDKERHPVLWFNGTDKGLVLKKTNAMTIASLYGPEMDDWVGKRITLYTEQVRAFGDIQTVIRVAKQIPPAPPPKQESVVSAPDPQPQAKEERRQYLKQVAELAAKHDSLFDEPSDVGMLRFEMLDNDQEGLDPMPVVASKGKAHSMYSYLLECIDNCIGVDGCAEAILSYLLGRVVTGATPPTLGHRFLLDDLMPEGEGAWADAILATWGVIQDNVRVQ